MAKSAKQKAAGRSRRSRPQAEEAGKPLRAVPTTRAAAEAALRATAAARRSARRGRRPRPAVVGGR